ALAVLVEVVGDLADPVVAVPPGVLVQVALVVVLGVVEGSGLGGGSDLGGDLAVPGLGQGALVAVRGVLGGGQLLVGGGVDGRAVLGADVVALPVRRGGVVVLPERLEQDLEVHLGRV